MKFLILIALLVAGCIDRPASASDGPMIDGGAMPDGGPMPDVRVDEDDGIGSDIGGHDDVGDFDDAGRADTGPVGADGGRDADGSECRALGRPIGLWNMEESVGDEVSNSGTANLPALVLTNATLEPGRGGDVLVTTGASDIEPYIPDSPAFDLDAGTVALWVRANNQSLSGAPGIVSRDARQQDLNGHWTVELQNGRPYARLQSTSDEVVLSIDRQIPADTWVFLAFTWREGEVSLSLNADDAVREAEGWSTAGNDNPIGIAQSMSSSPEGGIGGIDHFSGAIDDVMIWDRALTRDELVLVAKQICDP